MPEETRCWNDLATDNVRLRAVNAKLVEAAKDARFRLRMCAAAHDNDAETIAALLKPLDDAIAAAEGDA